MKKLHPVHVILPLYFFGMLALLFMLPSGCEVEVLQDPCNSQLTPQEEVLYEREEREYQRLMGDWNAIKKEIIQSEVVPEPEVIPEVKVPVLAPPEPKFSQVDPLKATYEDYLRATCRVRGGGSGGSGTCCKIDDKYVYVLTCRHVVGKTKDFTIEFWIDGRVTGKYVGKVSKILSVDAAVILIPVSSFKEGELPVAIPISRTAPDKSEPIVSVGSPGLGWQTLFEGHITKMNKKSKQSFEFIPPPKGGRSGSAILQNGKIVGVLWGRSDDKGRGYAVTCMDLQSLNEVSNLFFTANWCKHCREMKPVVEALKEDGLNVQIIDYNLNTAFAELYGINSLPAYVNTQGETISGVKTAGELKEFYQ